VITGFDAKQLERFRELIGRCLGLQFEDVKLGFLADVLRRRLEVTGQGSDGYLARLDAEVPRDEEVTTLAQELTVAETYFFRHVEQYRAFAEVALPDRLRRAQATGTHLQIASAGCASGEEPYSLAIVVRDAVADPSSVSILGVDINSTLLEKAARGRFSAWVLRDTPHDVQRRWFRPEGRDFVLDDTVRGSVRFEVRNLSDDQSEFWRPESQDIVFCRNVLMYFAPVAALALVSRLTRMLRPGGYLFLGHAETLRGLSNDFHLRHTHGTFYYQRKDRVAPGPHDVITASPGTALGRQMLLADVVCGAPTWIEAIRQASERIEALVESPKQPGASHARFVLGVAKPSLEIGLALELLKEERFAEALELVEAFPPDSGRNTEVLLLHAVLLTHSGQLTKAERTCEQLLNIDELNAGAHYLLALCREGAGDRPGAFYHDQVAVYVDPGFAMAHLHLGLLAQRAKDRETARRELEQAHVLFQREDAARLLLFGGGFSREALVALCRAELLRSRNR
jgi:chemotaxis protein methyltransferase CheR